MLGLRRALLTLLLAGGCAAEVHAHSRSISYSAWRIDGRRAEVTLTLAALEVSRFPWAAGMGAQAERRLGEYATERLRLLADGAPCPVSRAPRRLAVAPETIVLEWQVACPSDGDLRLHSDLLYDVAPSHLHFARVRRDNASALEQVLSDALRDWTLAVAGVDKDGGLQGFSLADYVRVGIDHILSGPDHLTFVFALLLIGSSLVEVAKVVTGFTVAHSITLALAVLGYLQPERAAIEALIGLSIAMVALENVWLTGRRGWMLPAILGGLLTAQAVAASLGFGSVPALTLAGLALFSVCYFRLLAGVQDPTSFRWGIAFLFGLVHGFGFAGILLEAQLPADRLAKALVGFNVGVEFGQFAVVALVWPLLRYAARLPDGRWHGWAVEVGSACVLAVGLFWFVTRTYG